MKILVIGCGFLGKEIIQYFLGKNIDVKGVSKNGNGRSFIKLDATNHEEIAHCILSTKPDIVINTIGLSSYFECEKQPALCELLNYDVAINIANSCLISHSKLIYLSSSYVFSGNRGNYDENDLPDSVSKYAITKVRSENQILNIGNSIVLRLEPVYGCDVVTKRLRVGTNYIDKGLYLIDAPIIRKPIWLEDIPKIIFKLINNNKCGIFHIAGEEELEWSKFVMRLAGLINKEDMIVTLEKSNWLMEPPYNTSLNTKKIESLGVVRTSIDASFQIMDRKIRRV